MNAWEFVNNLQSSRDHWRWRKKDAHHNVVLESTPFPLFLSCLADARVHGFDLTEHGFALVNE
jgi:hypothetical protein